MNDLSPRGRVIPVGLSIQEVSNLADLEALRPEWERLLAGAPDPSAFLSYEWFQPWWRSFGRGDLAVFVVRDGAELVGLAPLARRRLRPAGLPLLRSLTNEHSAKYDWLAPSARVDEVVAALVANLAEQDSWQVLECTYLPENSATAAAVDRQARARGWRVRRVFHGASPYIPIQGDWSEFFAHLPKSLRSNLRNRERKLHEAGPVAVVSVRDPERIAEVLPRAFAIEAAGWKGRRGTAIASSRATHAFYTELAARQSEQGRLVLYFLQLDGQDIAFRYCLDYRGTFSSVKTGYDPRFARYSPGLLLMEKILEELFRRSDHVRYDMLGTPVPWKMEWTRRLTITQRMLVYRPGLFPSGAYVLQFAIPDLLKRSAWVRRLRSWWQARRGDA